MVNEMRSLPADDMSLSHHLNIERATSYDAPDLLTIFCTRNGARHINNIATTNLPPIQSSIQPHGVEHASVSIVLNSSIVFIINILSQGVA